jgi:hypothetical protein
MDTEVLVYVDLDGAPHSAPSTIPRPDAGARAHAPGRMSAGGVFARSRPKARWHMAWLTPDPKSDGDEKSVGLPVQRNAYLPLGTLNWHVVEGGVGRATAAM